MQLASSSCLAAPRERGPVGCQGTFPTGRSVPIFPLSLYGFCTGHSRKALGTLGRHNKMLPLVSIGGPEGKLPCIPVEPSGRSFAKYEPAALFAPFLPFVFFFSQSWLLFLSIMLICYNSVQLEVLFHPITILSLFTFPSQGFTSRERFTLFSSQKPPNSPHNSFSFQVPEGGYCLQFNLCVMYTLKRK